MMRGNTSKKRPREQSEQWLDYKISFPSTPGCQLVDSPIILEALIEGFLVQRIYVDGGSSSEVMYEHCFRNLGDETRAKLKESRTPLVGFFGKGRKKEGEPEDTVQPPPNPLEKDTQTCKEIKRKDEDPKRPIESKSLEKVVIHDDYPDQTIIIGGNLSAECTTEAYRCFRLDSDRHDCNSLCHYRTRTQDVPPHRAESAKEMEHSPGQKKSYKSGSGRMT
nr:reverse transcriptase domain-containing protein [Tanacetum cinerariifolium]